MAASARNRPSPHSAEQRVANNFALHNLGELAMITGSNMSGKSTFLRTLGVNLSLAYAGGPVCARHLQTSLFRLFTSLNVNDSLSDGFSFFYAEVRRLKALLEALKKTPALPLFFLIDEIFKGTNNRERLIGSRAYLRRLIRLNAIGFLATHDLELATLAEESRRVKNFHFRDEGSLGPDDVDAVLAWLDVASRPSTAESEPDTGRRGRRP